MEYIIIEELGGNINLVCEENESGETLVLDSLEEAEKIAKDCQNPIIVPLVHVMYIIKEFRHRMVVDNSLVEDLALYKTLIDIVGE